MRITERMHDVRVRLTNGGTVTAVEFLGRYFSGTREITSLVVAVVMAS